MRERALKSSEQGWSTFASAPELRGRVVEARGVIARVVGVSLRIGEKVRLVRPDTLESQYGEVVGFAHDGALVMPLAGLAGLSDITEVQGCGAVWDSVDAVGLLGRVVDGLGNPLDGGALPPQRDLARGARGAPGSADSAGGEITLNPLERPVITTPFATGVRAIDGLLTCGLGQRTGIFAPAGGGKSTIMGMIANGASTDAIVVALIGERGREVGEFIHDHLDRRRASTVVIAATSDRPAAERIKAAELASQVAVGLRASGRNVLLLFDSLTRYARALRELGLAVGEPPLRGGFPPSVFARLPKLIETAGVTAQGSITGFYTVLADEADLSDPVAEEARSLLDGHIQLSSKLGASGHYPAIDILRSRSRLMNRVADKAQLADANGVRDWLARYEEIEMLLQIGEYERGHDAETDLAIERRPAIQQFLRQPYDRSSEWDDTRALLHALRAGGQAV
ncbi:FliI/YscN family ATPase [Paraburkholderia bryophila]|uniref:FliI/YscN family ATPase n=1 Tax=Paraburkholderia bryophila TaxID=420952 RepID=UPI00234B9CDF|nr:FliI/YscN family ATPase [Paraburkholderia bryophila]WCM20977.1 FliI/YscN family ATPase [Paraburkholderia bryophila]